MKLGYQTITWGGVVGDPVGVTSVKDLFYRVNGSMERAVRDIAAAGYQGVEMFDGNLVDYVGREEELRGLLEGAGVKLVSVYTGGNYLYDEILPAELHRAARAAELAASYGAISLVVGGGAQRHDAIRAADYGKLAAALDQISDIAAERGLVACYHPHLTTIVESPQQLEELMQRSRIAFCPDTGHIAAGGGDPATLIRQYADRLQHVHLKDLRTDPFSFVPLGQGELDFAEILNALADVGYDGWTVVELDSYDGDPSEAAQISKAYLDQLLSRARRPDGVSPLEKPAVLASHAGNRARGYHEPGFEPHQLQ